MSTNSTITSIPTTSETITTSSNAPSSTVVTSSSAAGAPSSEAGSTTTILPSTTFDTTSIVSASSVPASTQLITSVIVQSPTAGGTSVAPVTVVITSETTPTNTAGPSTTSADTTSTSSPASLQNQGSNNGSSGLSTPGKTAIAVVVPVVAVALLVLGALFFWRKRKQRKSANEARRKEVEEYGYNPNHDPTLPTLATDGHSEMAEDHGSGYRGWGASMSNRKASTTMSGGHTHGQLSDSGSNPGGFSTSPTAFGGSDGQNSEMHMKQRDTMTSDDLAALGAAPAANTNRGEMRRGPSNASSSYSAGRRSDHSDPSLNQQPSEGHGSPQSYAYNQPGPYGDGSYGGGEGMPVVRDVSARRNTRIEHGGGYQQGNSGIAQNF